MSEPNNGQPGNLEESEELQEGGSEPTLEVTERLTVEFSASVSSVTNKPGGEGGTPG